MTDTTTRDQALPDVTDDLTAIYRDGIVGHKGAFTREWVQQMREDMDTAYEEAIKRPGGAVGRGPKRWYVEVHPQAIRGFLDLVSHPWVQAINEAVLGPDYEIVEIGFDVPFPGAKNQPWHRDFPSPRETYEDHRIISLAFNVTGVDTIPEMGPFEIAPGTQWENGLEWNHEMFPPESLFPHFESLGQLKMPQMGDISARSPLTVHRGTSNLSQFSRPVLVLGVDAPGAGHSELHDLQVTPDYYRSIPANIQRHLVCRVVDELEPIVQKHQIEGLVMGSD
jgi:hypothetical protein